MFQIYTFLSYILIALYVSGCIIFNDLLIFFLLAFFVGFSNVHISFNLLLFYVKNKLKLL